jgi:MFS transporter, DHA1 family, multidrug resistance protein
MTDRRRDADWHTLLTLYWITSFIEGLGVSQIYAFLPNRLDELGLAEPAIQHFVGILGALFFVSGLPFIPLWGVWADKYSRKAVIVRSALVEAVVFGIVAASQTLWQVVLGMLLVGFQLGNSGVMMAAIRDVTPHRRLGLAMGLFAASSPLGFGAGPAIGAFMIDQLHTRCSPSRPSFRSASRRCCGSARQRFARRWCRRAARCGSPSAPYAE